MAYDGSNCPEDSNSTDCLLRSLLNLLNEQRMAENAETNWDPIAFYVTLLIGILATMFAGATILQAVLTAAKGRRKTNKRAIGPWSQGTERHWNWRDMIFESVAFVPILREDTLQAWIDEITVAKDADGTGDEQLTGGDDQGQDHMEKPQEDPGSTHQEMKKTRKGHQLLQWLRNSRQHTPSATWVKLFDSIGITKDSIPGNKNGLQPVPADYLPDDLIAAPAYTQIGLLVTAAALRGAKIPSIDENSQYSVIIGPNFQFDFREHPILGTIGAYNSHAVGDLQVEKSRSTFPLPQMEHPALKMERKAVEKPKLTLPTLKMAFDYARGRVELDKGMFVKEAKSVFIANLLHDNDRSWITELFGSPHRYSDRFTPSLQHIAPEYISVAFLFLASRPSSIPMLFPMSAIDDQFPATILALNTRFWSTLGLKAFRESNISQSNVCVDQINDSMMWAPIEKKEFAFNNNKSNHSSVPMDINQEYILQQRDRSFRRITFMVENMVEDSAEWRKQTSETFSMISSVIEKARHLPPNASSSKVSNAPKDMITQQTSELGCNSVVLHMCFKLLSNHKRFLESFTTFPYQTQTRLRSMVYEEIERIDEWLLQQEKKCVDHHVGVLCCTTMVLLKLYEAKGMEKESNPEVIDQIMDLTDRSQPENDEERRTPQHSLQDSASQRHNGLLDSLRNLIDEFGLDEITFDAMEKIDRLYARKEMSQDISAETSQYQDIIEDVKSKIRKHRSKLQTLFEPLDLSDYDANYCNIYLLLERLAMVVACNLNPDDEWTYWNRSHAYRVMNNVMDNVILHRCLMLAVLFWTAQDSSKMIQSLEWKRLIPVI